MKKTKRAELPPMNAKRAALYIRVSSDEQAKHGYSLGEQQHDLEQYAKKKGFAIVGLYADEGASARKAISRRHELQRLLRDIEADRVDTIVLKSLDRWTRSVKDFYKMQEILDAHGVTLEFTRETDYNTDTSSGRLMLNLRLTIAQHESDNTGERIKYVFEGMRRQKRVITGKMPFGYRLENKKILVDEERAEIVRFCFARILEGNSVYSLLDSVYARFGVTMNYISFSHMVNNQSYFGRFYGVDGMAEPIISQETFERAQAILKRHPRKASDFVYLFSGLIRCPVCGRKLIAHREGGNLHAIYRCGRWRLGAKIDGGKLCSYSTALGEARLEKWLLENVARLVADCQASAPPPKKRKSPLENIRAKMERLREVYIEGALSKTQYHERLEKLKTQERAALEDEIQQANPAREMPAVLRGKDFSAIYETWEREKRRAFWQGLIKRIEFDYNPERRLTPRTPLEFRVEFL